MSRNDLWDNTEPVALKLKELLNATELYQVVEASVANKEIQFLGRIHYDKERAFANTLAYALLVFGKEAGLSVFIGKQLLLVENNKLVRGWAIALSGEGLVTEEVASKLFDIISEHIPIKEVEEQPLLGNKSNIQTDQNKKGARIIPG